MKYLKIQAVVILLMAITLTACKKNNEDPRPEVDVMFKTSVDGYTVNFQNETKGAVSYQWDFGDGNTSTEENPTHTYEGKGKYVPTLFVTSSSGKVFEGSTVLRISKSSPVKLDDQSFEDWEEVDKYVFVSSKPGNAVRKAKFDYDGSSVYFYFEMTRTVRDNDVFDIYMDTDDKSSTGYDISGNFPGAGIDVLVEGQILGGADAWAEVFYHVGPGSGWSWDVASVAEPYQLGTVKTEGGLTKVEGRFERTKLKGLTGKAMKIGIILTKSDWSAEVGYIPDSGSLAISIDMAD